MIYLFFAYLSIVPTNILHAIFISGGSDISVCCYFVSHLKNQLQINYLLNSNLISGNAKRL